MKRKEGFTLIELMIVVAIIGILAAVAIPSFLKFIRDAKYSELPLNMRGIRNGAIAWYHAEHTDTTGNPMSQHFPNSNSPSALPPITTNTDVALTPAVGPCGSLSKGALYVKNTQSWNMQPWLSLKFSITKAHYGQYYYNPYDYIGSTGPGVPGATIVSIADLDCDGTMRTYYSEVTLDSSTGNLVSPEIFIFSEFD